jgi:hypothetical protein
MPTRPVKEALDNKKPDTAERAASIKTKGAVLLTQKYLQQIKTKKSFFATGCPPLLPADRFLPMDRHLLYPVLFVFA